jgi:hypothetical protein
MPRFNFTGTGTAAGTTQGATAGSTEAAQGQPYIPSPVTPMPTPDLYNSGPITATNALPGPLMQPSSIGTPFFQQNAGGLTPGTIPVAGPGPISLETGAVPLMQLATNPNLTPTILGGQETLGYYTDRFGNRILSPGAVGAFAEGGEVDAEAIRALMKRRRVDTNFSTAKEMLDSLSTDGGERVDIKVSPKKRTLRRASKRPISGETPSGSARGMVEEFDELSTARGPRSMETQKTGQQRIDFTTETLSSPELMKASIGRAGDLMTRRFKDGGEVAEQDPLLAAQAFLRKAAVKRMAEGGEVTDSKKPESQRYLGESIPQAITAPLEVLATLGTAGTTGLLGQAAGFGAGAIQSLARGDFGSEEASRRIAESTALGGEMFTYRPRTSGAQGFLQSVGDTLSAYEVPPLPGVGGVVGGVGAAAGMGLRAKPASSASIYTPVPTAEAPFVGRLDQYVASLPGATTKRQFLGQLEGKFRGYEVSRAKDALADLDNASRLEPSDLLNRLQTPYNPADFETQVREPVKGAFYASYDNVYSEAGQPVGVIYLNQGAASGEVDVTKTLVSDMGNAQHALSIYIQHGGNAEKEAAIGFLERIKRLSPQAAPKVEPLMEKLDLYEKATQQSDLINVSRDKILYPSIGTELKTYMDTGMPYEEARSRVVLDGMKEAAPILAKALDVDEDSYTGPTYQKAKTAFDDAFSTDSNSDPQRKSDAQRQITEYARELADELDTLKDALTSWRSSVRRDIRDQFSGIKQNLTLGFQGRHSGLQSPNQIAFSRFTEHETNIPGFGPAKGIYVSELQSDLRREISEKGRIGGRQEDIDEIAAINDAFETPSMTQPEMWRQIRRRQSLARRVEKNDYSARESFPAMERSSQVLQQLMAKNVISAAIRRGDNFVAFPGAESSQAQLYEKLPNNLKQVVKDLGPGFDINQVTLTDNNGVERMHRAVVWDQKAAERIRSEGVPFKHGGLVDKNTAFIRKMAKGGPVDVLSEAQAFLQRAQGRK